MQFVDRHTNPSRLDGDIQPLIEAILHNRRIFDADQDDPPFVTEALKYRCKRQQRRQTSPYTGSDEFVESIIDLFGFDPLDFQVECWQTVDELDRERRSSGTSKAAVFSAPTGFGKTEAFLGPLYQLLREGRQGSTAIVYPSRALLQDQLGRVLEHVHRINAESDDRLSVGVYTGGTPYEMEQVESSAFFERGGGRPRFRLANCWCGDDASPNAFEYRGTSRGYTLRCEANHEHSFTDRELLLSRKEMVFHNQPDIVLTTLESLEGFALKPHYPLIDEIETIVLDEVHLNTQMRGAHASKIIQNINEITDQPLLWLGSSATIDDAERFGKRLFGVPSRDIRTVEPGESDFDDDHDDYEHYYFMLASPDGPGASSMSIQQHLLLGHSLLEQSSGERGKMLAFIDSISQVNQKHTQLQDADHNRELWRYHLGDDDGVEDWRAVAEAMDHRFLDEHLEFLPVYSDRGFDSSEVGDSDVLLSTSFLEVGIDVGEIKTITQYRTPWDLSSFKQRAGRAARKEGMDAHIAVMLSGLTGDANMFYRADRFLDSDIRTPLKTDNAVVEWIHERFREYYEVADDVSNRNLRLENPNEVFLEEYLGAELGYGAYERLVLSPSAFLEDEFGLDVAPESLLSEQVIGEASDALTAYLDDRRETFTDIESFFDLDDGNVIRGEDAVDTYVYKVQDSVLDLIKAFSGQVSGYRNELESLDESGYDSDVEALEADLVDLRESASKIPEGDTQTKVQHFESLLGDLFGLSGQLIKLQSKVNRASEKVIPQVRTDQLSEVQEAVTRLNSLSDDDRIQEYYRTQKRVYYLQQTLDELEEFVGYRTPFLSLYAIRHLLRGAYYLDRYLQADDRTLGEVWYVPPNYYGDAGRFFSVFQPDSRDSTDESIDKLVSTYTPYRSEYQSKSNEMHAFLPRTTVTEDGVEFDFSQHVSGQVRDGILVPDSIELSAMADLSDDAALNIVRYCPKCYQILTDVDQCLRHEERELGKIHSDPQVKTRVGERTVAETTGATSLADMSAEVTLEGVTLSIRPASAWGTNVTFDQRDPFEVEIDAPEETLGFQIDTRGLVFDVSAFLDRVDGETARSLAERYNEFGDVDYEYVAYHTAAHFFLQLVSDVSAVNTSMLLYGFDRDAEEVYVFERTEGGQGVVDLVYDDLTNDPGTVLEALNRIAYNSQVINERLWAQEAFVQRLTSIGGDEDDVASLVEEALGVPYTSVVERVTQEVLSSIDKAEQFSADEELAVEDAYQVKQTVAREQVTGCEEFPADAITELGLDLSDVERAKTVFFSPDIDGCVENLHLGECIAATDQSDALSYVLLEALRESLTHTVPTDETSTEMFDRERLPAGEFDGTSVFLTF